MDTTRGYAVVDFETTGVRRDDRAIEVGVVLVAPNGSIEHEAETLIHVTRDLGPQYVHHITAAELMHAPDFSGIAVQLWQYLSGRIFVAHNVNFDARVLTREYARIGYQCPIDEHNSLCTMIMGGRLLHTRSLADCCDACDIDNHDAHSALGDAHATALLLAGYMKMIPEWDGWNARLDAAAQTYWPKIEEQVAPASWYPRPNHGLPQTQNIEDTEVSFLERIAATSPGSPNSGAEAEYMDLLDRCLVDARLSEHEKEALADTATALSLDRPLCARIHERYFAALAEVAWSDDRLTSAESVQLQAVGHLLDIPHNMVDKVLRYGSDSSSTATGRHARIEGSSGGTASRNGKPLANAALGQFHLVAGDRVVLTGTMQVRREEWVEELEALGLVVLPNVTKKVKLLIAADPDSESGKAQKARKYGIPIVGEAWLMQVIERGIDIA